MKTNLLSNLSNGLKKGTGLTQVGYRQGTGKVQAGEKQACGRKESLAWSQVELISDEGAIEHPLSTHSAPFGTRWKPAGEKGSSRVWKYVAMIFAVLVMSMANVGMAWGQGVSYVCGFENGTDSWSKSSMGTLASEATEVRTGGKSLKCPCSNANGYARKSVTITKGYYTHYIVWAKSSASTNASLLIDGTATSETTSIGTSGWTQITHSKQYTGSGTQSKNFDIKPGMASGNFFVDDVIIYYSSSSTTDVTAPSAATSASATTSSISWTNGSDANTGRQNTLIWKRNSGNTHDLSLNNQGVYAANDADQSGNWTCISATVAAGTDNAASSHSGTYTAGAEYAIVHRDLAYNYSTPTYVTVAAGGGCSAPTSPSITGTTEYTAGQDISLTASATGTSGTTTYTWYKGANWAAASATTPVQAASTSGATFTKASCVVGDAGTYWCNISNGTGCEVQVSQTITVAAAVTTHTVTAATENASYGTAAAASTTVAEGATTTITATPEAGYQFDHWTVSGTGATLSSTTTNPTTLTMGTANATVTAYFVEKSCPSSGTLYTAAVKSSVLSNQSFPASATTEVSPTTQADITGGQLFAINGESSAKNLIASSSGYKFCMTNNSTKFKLVLECELQVGDIITIDGVGGTKDDAPIGLWVSSSDSRPGSAPACSGTSTTTSLVDDIVNYTVTSSDEYHGKSILYIHRAVATSTYFNNINISRPAAPSCTAPNHVEISGRWDRFGGETISLTATAYSSAGTGSPIADGDITGWQWEKLIGSTWTALSNGTVDGVTTSGATTKNLQIANCGAGNSGKYRCVVSTGATCSTPSATKTDGTEGFGVKVYVLECYTGGTTVYNFTRTGDTQAGTCQITLAAGSHTFKFHADQDYYGNNGTIHKDENNWVCSTSQGNLTIAAGLGGTFTIGMEYSTGGNSSVEGEPEISVTYPRKTIYLVPNSDWLSNNAKFAYNYFGTEGNGWTDFLTNNDCGMSAEIPQWDGLNVIAVRFNPSDATPGWNGDGHVWNQTGDIAATADKNCVTITDWNAGTYGTYSTPTYTISYATGSTTATGGAAISGSKASESKTCGVDFTLPSSAVFTATGYTQVGWTTTDGGAQEYALGGTYTTNEDKTFYPVWEVAASLTALECNTLYTPADMLPSGKTISSGWQYDAYGLSGNTKFFIVGNGGDQSTAEADAGIVEIKTGSAVTISGTGYSNYCYFKKAPQMSGTTPTSKAIKFILSGSGSLDVYGKGVLALVKEGGSPTTKDCTSTPSKVTWDNLTAGTYYLYATGTSRYMVAMQFNCCTTPAAPTAFSAGSITSAGATFSITDAADAASYDIYYSTSSTAPTASTPATTTSTSKTKAVTGLTASTTYYAWVRSVCDADHKSAWVALTGSSFTTTSTPAELTAIEANVLYQAADMANITFTGSDQWFAGLSTNAKFKTYGDGSSTSAKGKTVSSTSITDDIDTKNFTSIAYIMTADNTSSTSDPTKGAIEFITPSTAGYLYLYFENTSSALTLKKKGTSTSLSLSGAKYKKVAVEANTHYFINGAGSNRGLYGIKFIADVTAPTFVSSVPANGATGVATSGTIVLTFSEALGSVDASKFTLTGATKGSVTIDGSDASKVNITYSGAEEEATVTLATAAAAVSDLAGNALAAALSNISFTTAAAAPAGDCEELFAGLATSTSVFTSSVGSATVNLSSGNSFSEGGYSYSVKPNSSNAVVASPKDGSSFAAGDSLIVVIYNNESGAKTMGFRLGSGTYNTSVGSKKLHVFRQVLVASDISAGKVTFNRQSSDDRWVEIIIKRCGLLPSCTTPTLPTLTNQSLCEGTNGTTWDATITNSGSLASGETVAYSWVKKGSSTVLSSVATYQPTSVTEAMAGTYVVTATVSADGKASKSASKEVELSVTEETEVTNITADKATVYPGNSVTLTATANTTVTWEWYTCTNAEGAGESFISGATSASYTIASAGAADTYYYKAKGTSSCGTGERVYTLTVSPAAGGDCFHFVSVIPASDFNASSGASLVTPTHATTLEGGTMKVGSQQVTFTKDYGLKMEGTKTVSITLDAALEAGNVVIVKGTSGTKGYGITINGVNFYDADNKTFDVSYTVLADDGLVGKTALTVSKYSGNSYLQEVKITGCGESCTDPEVTASADNTTACVGTSVTFTATGAHAEATYQWQKLNGTWTNISGATESTYTITSVVAGDAGKYRVIASNDCNRTSNEVTLSVPSVPDFGSTVPASVSVMQTIALSINTVEATDAVKYRWYKSADPTWDAGDVEIGTNKELIKAYDSEAIGSPSYYIFCRAQNSCGITTSSAIAVNVTTYVEEDCATRGNEGDAAFSFENSGAGQGSYESTACWTMNSNSKILVYYPPTGKYFKTAKVTIASSSESKASYNWSTNGGTDYTAVSLTVNSTLTERTIDLSAHGNVNAFQIGRNFDSKGSSSGTLYVSKICFEYTDACTATTVTPSTESTSYEMGGEWTDPTFTLSVAGTLSYSSSNEDIASVDDDGTVTFNGEAGTVTITASYAGGTISETEYCASSGSYTINVSCPGGAPKVVADGSTDMSGCNSSVTLHAKTQADGDFADGTYQWFRNGEEIDGATSSSYTATQAGTYTVERTNGTGCTTPSTNSAIVTSETTEPEVERLVPFQYYHVDKTYSDQMKMRHLFAVKNSGKLDGKSFKMYVSRSGGAATDVTSSNALVVVPNGDGHVDTVMVDLNKLSGKYSENDELVYTCKAIDCSGNVSDVYKETITMNVIGATPTLALICSGSSKAGGTRKTGELTVGGDFLTGYNVADLCQQTGNTSFDANTEWGLYTDLKTQYIVTPVNGYAVFNKLNYEPFDILLLTDYPKASKSDAAKDVLDDMAALCDYRPMLSFKTHMVAKSPSKWAEKGFTTSPVVTKADGRLNLNIVCYAHPMFNSLKTGDDVYTDVGNTSAPLVYTMLTGTGYESSKGMQGFELAAAENFVTIGLTHYNATIAKNSPLAGEVEWTPGSEDRMLVTVAERQANLEARFILFSLNCGAQSKLTDKGEEVILACLEYLLDDDPLHVADCSFTFDNGAGNNDDDATYKSKCPECTGTKGDGLWTTAANWGPDYRLLPGEFTSVRIKKPVEVDDTHAHVMEVRIIDEGSIDIPAGKALDVKSTIRRMDGSEIYPTEISDIHIGSASTGNGTLIFNNDDGDTKARVDMYTTAKADAGLSAAASTWQYIGTPYTDVANARSNYYGSWLYQYGSSGWEVIPNGGPLEAFRGYCITHPDAPVVFDMHGTLAATSAVDLEIPVGYTVIANSWVAPIDITTLTDDDMENISDKTVYFFNTGTDAEGTAGTGTAPGTYVSVPKNSASYIGTWQIPSMQGFYLSSTSAGTLHLDYDRHVRPSTDRSIVSNPMYAPRRAKAVDTDEPAVLKIYARGSRYHDKLVVLEREDFTRGYDSGWDGEAWGGSDLSPMVYVTGDGREDAVSAIPEFEGTVIAFKAGEDSEYRLDFVYDGEESLYLLDIDNNTYTQIMTGNAYAFTTNDKSAHSRFVLTRKAPQIATGIEPTSDSSLKGRAKKLLIDDKMYILRNGTLYDATGKMVK